MPEKNKNILLVVSIVIAIFSTSALIEHVATGSVKLTVGFWGFNSIAIGVALAADILLEKYKFKIYTKKVIRVLIAVVLGAVLTVLFYATGLYPVITLVVFAITVISAVNILWMGLKIVKRSVKEEAWPHIGETAKEFFRSNAVWVPVISIAALISYIFTSRFFIAAIDHHDLEHEPRGSIVTYYTIAKSETGKEYTLPAEIYVSPVSNRSEYLLSDFHEYEDRFRFDDKYTVWRVFFKEDNYLYFDEPLEFDKIGQELSGIDKNGRDWKITLTKYHADVDYINACGTITKENTIEFIVISLISLIQSILWFVKIEPTEDFYWDYSETETDTDNV